MMLSEAPHSSIRPRECHWAERAAPWLPLKSAQIKNRRLLSSESQERRKKKKPKVRERQGEKRHTKNQSNNENKSLNNPSFHDDDQPNHKRYRVRGTSVNTPPFNLPHGHGGRGRDFENAEDFWSAHWWWREQPRNRRGVERCALTADFVCRAGDERPGSRGGWKGVSERGKQ